MVILIKIHSVALLLAQFAAHVRICTLRCSFSRAPSHKMNFIEYKSRSSGFSLIEILISLVIVSIIALFSVQGISSFFEHRQQRVYMQQLYHDLKWARVEAIVLNAPVKLQSNSDWCAGWEISSALQTLKHRNGIKNCKIIFSGSLSAPYFQFIPDGSSNYQNGHFYFYDQEKVTMKIIINPAGRVRWET